MEKIFSQIIIRSKALNIIVSAKRFFRQENRSKKAATFIKEYLTMPMSFDFTAYYGEDEVINNIGDISSDKPLEQKKASNCDMPGRNCNELQASAQCPHIEGCII
jgi:hypothetical protein